ncbi:GlmU family protein [Allomuricauda sp. d1]|uniref:GlmU family protein n=1 Tax=Allomuricauda sp. d1 TaxID=3136725 RepID=UPI0031D32097
MNYILADGLHRKALLPFTFTRPVAEIRIGILTISKKWEKWLGAPCSFLTEEYLQEKFPIQVEAENVVIIGSFLPDSTLVEAIKSLKSGEALVLNEEVLAYSTGDPKDSFDVKDYKQVPFRAEVFSVKNTWDIFSKNGKALQADFDLITKGRKSAELSGTNQLIHPENIFAEEGAQVEYSILNATQGPIYLAEDSQIWEGSLIRGGFALCEKAIVKMGAKIYGPTTVGPQGKVCGEINNSVIFGYSSKGHEGYLGNSVLGEWCNIGADSNNSNLKNNYAKVRIWNYATEAFDQTGLQFCGLMMGDHSKSAINTMFNTGTVVGVNVNIYTPGFPRNFIPSFSWGGASGFKAYMPAKAFETAEVMMARRGVTFDDTEKQILQHVFDLTGKWRKY